MGNSVKKVQSIDLFTNNPGHVIAASMYINITDIHFRHETSLIWGRYRVSEYRYALKYLVALIFRLIFTVSQALTLSPTPIQLSCVKLRVLTFTSEDSCKKRLYGAVNIVTAQYI